MHLRWTIVQKSRAQLPNVRNPFPSWSTMKEIGGYFEIELPRSTEYHAELLKLNSGRSAFKFLLKARNIQKVYIPNHICDSIIEPLEALSIDYEFYNIDDDFEIIQNIEPGEMEAVLYVNYFSLKSDYIKKLADIYREKLIVDNTQAFFAPPLRDIDTIYSPRKFFGVCDGGYLSTNARLNEDLDYDESYSHTTHLVGRIDKGASCFYKDFQKAEERLSGQPIKQMSKLTQRILASINYEAVIKIRKENFAFLHHHLCSTNLLDINQRLDFVPFTYPLMTENTSLRSKLIENRIYTPSYWTETLRRQNVSGIERNLVNKIIPLPVDQRYSLEDMRTILETIKMNKA